MMKTWIFFFFFLACSLLWNKNIFLCLTKLSSNWCCIFFSGHVIHETYHLEYWIFDLLNAHFNVKYLVVVYNIKKLACTLQMNLHSEPLNFSWLQTDSHSSGRCCHRQPLALLELNELLFFFLELHHKETKRLNKSEYYRRPGCHKTTL